MTSNKKPFFILCSLLFVLLNFALNLPLTEISTANSHKSTLKHSQEHLSNGFITNQSKAENTVTKRCTLIDVGITSYDFHLEFFQAQENYQISFSKEHFSAFLVSSSTARAPPKNS